MEKYVFLAPVFDAKTAQEGIMKFQNIRLIGEQLEKDGEDIAKNLNLAEEASQKIYPTESTSTWTQISVQSYVSMDEPNPNDIWETNDGDHPG